MTRFVHDDTLADLAHITAKVDITRAEATAERAMLATITIDPSSLFAILDAASLYRSDNSFKPSKINPNYPELCKQRNQEGQDWDDIQRDIISVLRGRLSIACDPKFGQCKDEDVAQNRKHRRIMAEFMPEPEIDENPPETMQDLKNKILELESKLARAKAALA